MPQINSIFPGTTAHLQAIPTKDDGGLSKKHGKSEFKKLRKRLDKLQQILYAQGKYALLVVFEAIDTGGKDSTIRSVFKGVNPQGCHVTSFKAPTEIEQQHDFLWRVHQRTPQKGHIGVFSRSHYEDVLVARVEELVPEQVWQARYDHINAFEKMLHSEGTVIVKFFLHISKEYQKERLQRRLNRPDKLWKFSLADLEGRKHWDDYQVAFEEMLSKCSTAYAPWHVIPAERRWYRNLLVARTLIDCLESLDLDYPEVDFDPARILIP